MATVKEMPKQSVNGKPTTKPQEQAKDLKTAPIKLEPEKASNDSPLEDRVLKVQTLFDMVTRREKLQESLKKLKSLNTSTENRNLSITIDDDETEWQTYNTDAIKACVDSMVLTIEQKISILDTLIKW